MVSFNLRKVLASDSELSDARLLALIPNGPKYDGYTLGSRVLLENGQVVVILSKGQVFDSYVMIVSGDSEPRFVPVGKGEVASIDAFSAGSVLIRLQFGWIGVLGVTATSARWTSLDGSVGANVRQMQVVDGRLYILESRSNCIREYLVDLQCGSISLERSYQYASTVNRLSCSSEGLSAYGSEGVLLESRASFAQQ